MERRHRGDGVKIRQQVEGRLGPGDQTAGAEGEGQVGRHDVLLPLQLHVVGGGVVTLDNPRVPAHRPKHVLQRVQTATRPLHST